MKSQSQVIQFLLFFLIGMSLLGIVGNFYKLHASTTRERIENSYIKLLSSYINANLISYIETCKTCEYENFSIRGIKNVAGFYNQVSLISSPSWIVVSSIPYRYEVISNLHNLNYTVKFENGNSLVDEMDFSYIRRSNKLLISGG